MSGQRVAEAPLPGIGGPVGWMVARDAAGAAGALADPAVGEGKPAAVKGSTATNQPSHIPQGGPFQKPPSDQGTIQMGSTSVLINGKGAAAREDSARLRRAAITSNIFSSLQRTPT